MTLWFAMVDKIMTINVGELHAGGQRKPLPPTPSHARGGHTQKHTLGQTLRSVCASQVRGVKVRCDG